MTKEDIGKESRSFINRLRSIQKDSVFVSSVCSDQFSDLPVYANERCGVWYVDKTLKNYGGTGYFKSTDGHSGKWDFNLRRNNFHLLADISRKQGCVIVDSTRNGKTMPDSFSKTIPIWCAVINKALFELGKLDSDPGLLVQHHIVSESEQSQISATLPEFVNTLKQYPGLWEQLDTPSLEISKPLRPLFVSPEKCPRFPWKSGESLDFLPIVLVNASETVADGVARQTGGTTDWWYVQGAADDHELWSNGLEADAFWVHYQTFASATADDCIEAATRALAKPIGDTCKTYEWSQIGSSKLFIGTCSTPFVPQMVNSSKDDTFVMCTEAPLPEFKNLIKVPISCSKKGRWQLRRSLPILCDILRHSKKFGRLYIMDDSKGMDAAVAVALAISFVFPNELGGEIPRALAFQINTSETCGAGVALPKQSIKNILATFQQYRPTCNPSRSFLNCVSDFVH